MNIKKVDIIYEDIKASNRLNEGIRGYLGNKYIEKDILHNHDGEKFLYRYPRVQYKIVKNNPMIVGILDGASIIENIGVMEDEFIIKGEKVETFQKKINSSVEEFGIADDYYSYEFISPWMALSQKNISLYNKGTEIEKEEILKKILIGNIISMSKGLGYQVDDKVVAWINLREKPVISKNIKHIAFVGEFKVNFKIPNYLGLGKSVSKGYGTVVLK